MHLNVCSLYKHFDKLNELITSLPFSPVVICLSEVRLRESLTQNVDIDGYKFDHLQI